ncbi:TonB-dependent receptor [Oceanicoccus sp. KOV_DT_Chl]|uniref:TonB-dependent receptor n=1 Tax=Oceanicoccus sp. KOV_DT_Chl TaxID=1904639 RepID=UPI000C7E00ED|nr:TonB-dependent receptor [Oceanicoccus sp. KOV_DT_Chl]
MNRKINFKQKTLVTAVATATLLSGQSLTVFGQEKSAVMEEVMVTATRRSQSVQDIPFNISAVSGSTIEAAGIVDSTELLRSIPGVTVADGGGRASETNNNISIRGLNVDPSSTDRTFLSDPTVSTYVGNTPTFANFILKDIERVEVLRGPQSTLYGSGSLGGTVRYIMNKPSTDAVSGRVGGSYSQTEGSDGDNKSMDGVINIPLSDSFALRLSAGEIDNDGLVDYANVYQLDSTGVPSYQGGDIVNGLPIVENVKDADTVDVSYARASLLFEPNEKLSILMTYQQQEGEYGGRRQVTTGPDGYGNYYDDDEIGAVLLEPASNDTSFGSLEIEYDLGFATLSSSTSYYDNRRESRSDNTGFTAAQGWLPYYGYGANPRIVLAADRENSDRALIQELRLASNGEKTIDWVAGVYYKDQNSGAIQDTHVLGYPAWANASYGFNPADDRSFAWTYEREFTDTAFFGEATYNVSDTLHVTFGGRYFDNEDDVTSQTGLPVFIDFFPINPEVSDKVSDDGILLKANISWEMDDHSMLYGTISEGYRRGGTNASPTASDNLGYPNADEWKSFDSDTSLNYEVGIKGQYDSFSYTFAAFYVQWDDIQLNVATPSGAYYAVANGDEAVTQGIETEFNWAVSDNFRLSGGYAYVDAALTADFITRGLEGGADVLQGSDGNQLPGTAEHNVNLTAAYTVQISDGMDLVTRIDGYYQSETENSVLDTEDWNKTLDGFSLWGGSVSLVTDTWTASLYAKNIFDEEGTTAVYKEEYMTSSPADQFYGTGQKDFIANPRTIGFSVGYKF